MKHFPKRKKSKSMSLLSSLDSPFHLIPTHQLPLVSGNLQLPIEILSRVLWTLDPPKSTSSFLFVLQFSVFKLLIHLLLVLWVTEVTRMA